MSCDIAVSSYVPFKNYISDAEISVSSYVPVKNYSSDVEISVSSYVPDDGSYDNNEDIDKNKYKDDKQYSYLDYNNNNDSTNGDNKKCPPLSAPEFEYIESGYGKLDYSLDAIGNASFAVYAGATAKIKIKNLKEMIDNGVDVKIITGVDSTSTDTDTGIITLNIPNKNGAGGTLHDIFLNVGYFDNCGNYETRSEMYSVEELPTGAVYCENLNDPDSGRWEYPNSMVGYFKGIENLGKVQVHKLPNNTTSLAHMCENCYSLGEFDMNKDVDISGITDISYAFNNCYRFFPRENSFLSRENNIENMSYAFNNRGAFGFTFPMIYTKNVTNMSYTWANTWDLTSFPLIDTSSVTNMSGAWSSCPHLSSFPLIDTSSVTNMSGAWSYCSSLSSFPHIVTSSSVVSSTWEGCTSLPLDDCEQYIVDDGDGYHHTKNFRLYLFDDGSKFPKFEGVEC